MLAEFNQTSLAERNQASRFPILTLLDPRAQRRTVITLLLIGVLGWSIAITVLGVPMWIASLSVVGLLLVPGVRKWADDRQRYGTLVMVLSVLLAAQGFHTIEHMSQAIQYHLLGWPAFRSSGLISTLNAEWVHFVWNWAVVATTIYLVRGGMRNRWAWLLLIWATAHSLEHTYLFVRYLEARAELANLGLPGVSVQGLPGVLGRDGWLAKDALTQGTFLCRAPGITTATRIDIHFWWNAGEMVLLLAAAHVFLKLRVAPDAPAQPASTAQLQELCGTGVPGR